MVASWPAGIVGKLAGCPRQAREGVAALKAHHSQPHLLQFLVLPWSAAQAWC